MNYLAISSVAPLFYWNIHSNYDCMPFRAISAYLETFSLSQSYSQTHFIDEFQVFPPHRHGLPEAIQTCLYTLHPSSSDHSLSTCSGGESAEKGFGKLGSTFSGKGLEYVLV